MMVLIVGAGRVGSAVARSALLAGHDVSILDEDPLSHERLEVGMDTSWEDGGGRFTVGTALEVEALEAAGIGEADITARSTACCSKSATRGSCCSIWPICGVTTCC